MMNKERLFESWNQSNSRACLKQGELNGHRSPRRKFKIGAKAITSRKASFLCKRVGLLPSIVRGAYRLEVTKLEVLTLTFSALTGVSYYLWWKKPPDVRCSIPVYLLKGDEKKMSTSRVYLHFLPLQIQIQWQFHPSSLATRIQTMNHVDHP